METGVNRTVRVIAAAALLVSAASLGYVVYRANCATCGARLPPPVQPATDVSDAGNRAIDHIANTLAHQASLSREDVDYLVRSAQQGTEVKVQRWALACMADHLHTDTALPPAVRTRMEQAVFAALASTNDRIAICAIACTEQAGLTSRPEFVSKIEELRRDGTPRVAERAARSPIHTGGGEG